MAETPTYKITIDNVTIEVPAGTTILQAARKIGGDIAPPAMCYYSKLQNTGGKCRTCLVEVAAGSERDPRPMPKLMPSCRTTVMDGMVVKNITSNRVKNARAGVVEFLLLNHPLDCPICDQAGECHLQDLGYEHGFEETRNAFPRRKFAAIDIGDYIKLHMNRCILCYRCVYLAEQITNKRLHGVINRGEQAEISTYIEQALDSEFAGNVIDVCPVGALTDRTFRFKNRVWFTNIFHAHRHCENEHCSGKTTLWMRGDDVLRVTAQKDEWGEVVNKEDGNPAWICNTCRFEKKELSYWEIDGTVDIDKHSVLATNYYEGKETPKEFITDLMKGHNPRHLMNIKNVSEVNREGLNLEKHKLPLTSKDFATEK